MYITIPKGKGVFLAFWFRLNKGEKEMTDITRETIYGKRPLRRINPQAGQSDWYYLDPRGASTLGSMKQIDVENEHSPNPYADEIQNYLYKNDEYNYKQLYYLTASPHHALWHNYSDWLLLFR